MQFWMIKTMHHWLGVAFGAFFFVICVSGVGVTLSQMGEDRQPNSQLAPAQIMQDMAGFETRGLLPEGADILISMPGAHRFGNAYMFRTPDGLVRLYNDGEAQAEAPDRGAKLASLLWNIHANLLNLFGVGHGLVIWSGMIGAYLSLLGIIIFVPLRRTFRKSSILHPQALTFREVRRAHFSSGIVFFVLVIFFGVTGWAAGAPQTASDILRPQTADLPYAPAPQTPIGIDSIIETAAQSEAPTSDKEYIYRIRLTESDQRAAVYVYLRSAVLPTRRIVFDRILGTVIAEEVDAPQSFGAKMNAKMADWHSGAGKSIIYKLLLCVTGLIAGLIALTGFVSYIWRWKIQIAGFLRRRKTKEIDG